MARTNRATLPAVIDQILKRLVERFNPERIILFGSYAYGKPHRDSDVDLLVVAPDAPSRLDSWRIAHEVGNGIDLPLHVHFISPLEFEETKDVIGGLAYPAQHLGRVLYEADG